MRKLTRPLAGIAGIVIVASAAAFAGNQFASPATSQAPVEASAAAPDAASEVVPVIAPIAIGGVAVDANISQAVIDAEGDAPAFDYVLSDVVGSLAVIPPADDESDLSASPSAAPSATPAEPSADPDDPRPPADPSAAPIAPEEAAAIAAIDEVGTPGAESYDAVADAMGTTPGETPATEGDPCSPTEGAPSDECPEGMRSVIFADTHIEDLEIWPVPDVATEPVGTSVYCTGLAPGEGELGLGVATNIPAGITVRYWPAADPANVTTLSLADVPEEQARWQAEIDATGTYTRGMYMFQHCGIMTGLLPNTDYVLSAMGGDVYGRISAPVERRFNSAGDPTVPQMFAVPITSSLVYVGVPTYGSANPPLVYAWLVPEGEAADCSSADRGHRYVREVQPQRLVEISADYLRRHNYASGYNHRVVSVYDVPEGSTLVACARWYDTARPSWSRNVPTKQQSISISTPDALRPVLTLTGLSTIRDLTAGSVRISASNAFGWECGEGAGPDADLPGGGTVGLNTVICNFGDAMATRSPASSTGNIVLTTAIGYGADRLQTRAVLRLGRFNCLGVCELPPSLTYNIPLPTVATGAGMCDSSFGPCDPPTRETALGTATVTVSWEQGNTNGLEDWSVGDVSDTEATFATSAGPQFDVDSYWVPTLSADGWTGTARATIRSDRAANFTAYIAGDCFIGPAPLPLTGRLTVGGADVYAAPLTFTGLCPGARYHTSVELVDDAGGRTVAGSSTSAGVTRWGWAGFEVPQRTIAISGDITIRTVPEWSRAWWLVGSDVYFGADERRAWADYGESLERCYSRDVHEASSPLSTSVVIDQERTVHLRAYSRVTTEAYYYGVNRDATCSWPSPNNWIADVDADISYEDLMRGVRIEGDLIQQGVPESRRGSGIRFSLFVRGTVVTE